MPQPCSRAVGHGSGTRTLVQTTATGLLASVQRVCFCMLPSLAVDEDGLYGTDWAGRC